MKLWLIGSTDGFDTDAAAQTVLTAAAAAAVLAESAKKAAAYSRRAVGDKAVESIQHTLSPTETSGAGAGAGVDLGLDG